MFKRVRISVYKAVFLASLALSFLVAEITAQSTDQNFPTRVVSNEIKGTIKVRDIGDSRLTTHYYLIDGRRGDVFVNVVTKNINGTIDIFTKTGLRPKTKISLFADNINSETGRVVYLRENELLILRVQGRSPNDQPGTYQFKFAGSFVALADDGSDKDPFGDRTARSDANVNSAGAIIDRPKLRVRESNRPRQGSGVADNQGEDKRSRRIVGSPTSPGVDKRDVSVAKTATAKASPSPSAEKDTESAKTSDRRTRVIGNANSKETTNQKAPASDNELKGDAADKEGASVTVEVTKKKPTRSAIVRITRDTEVEKPESIEEKLARTSLVVNLSNGTRFQRPMSEVLKFSVDEGILTIITKDGFVRRFSIVDVEKISIQ